MTRSVCCLVLTGLFAACAPKAVVLEETPVTKPKQTKPQARPSGDESPAAPQLVVQQSGMQLPDMTRLPDRKDMTPTAAPATGGGATAIATPPKQ